VRLTISPLSCAECHEYLGAETSWNPLGHTGPVTGFLYLISIRDCIATNGWVLGDVGKEAVEAQLRHLPEEKQ